MKEVYRDMRKNGLPFRCQVSEKARKVIEWCLHPDPRKRPSTVELLNHVVEVQKARPVSQSVRQSFTPIDNQDFKVKFQKKVEVIRSGIDNFWEDNYKKEDILRSCEKNRIKPGISTYTEKKKLF